MKKMLRVEMRASRQWRRVGRRAAKAFVLLGRVAAVLDLLARIESHLPPL